VALLLYRPRPRVLCVFCSFGVFSPVFGGAPADAEVVLRSRAEAASERPPLPLFVG
jgi:hypothetical protein